MEDKLESSPVIGFSLLQIYLDSDSVLKRFRYCSISYRNKNCLGVLNEGRLFCFHLEKEHSEANISLYQVMCFLKSLQCRYFTLNEECTKYNMGCLLKNVT